MKAAFLDQLLRRIDRIDPGSLQTHFLRLAREKGLLETILQSIREGLVVVDGKGIVTYANDAVARLLGGEVDQMMDVSLEKALPTLDWEGLMGLDPEAWTRMVNREIEVTYPERRIIEFYVVPLQVVQDAEEDAEGALIFLRDVTAERKREETAVESKRLEAITLLAAGVAHEIGNPLNSINIHLQLLDREIGYLENETARDELKELVEVSRKEVGRLDTIIRQFLKALRPSLPERKPHRLQTLLQDTLEVIQHEIRDRRMLVETDFAKDAPAVMVDDTQVKQVFFNVIKNALQAMADGGILKLESYLTDRYVAVTVEDNGSGIDPDKLGAIYEPYHTTKAEGTGLGMMIVQRIMRDHGGEIEINSEPGRGTRLTLRFPREDTRMNLLIAPEDNE